MCDGKLKRDGGRGDHDVDVDAGMLGALALRGEFEMGLPAAGEERKTGTTNMTLAYLLDVSAHYLLPSPRLCISRNR